MSNQKWKIAILLLFALFAFLLLQFLLSTIRIRALVKPPEAGPPNGQTARHVVLISQEMDNPYWRSIEQGAREAAGQFGMELEYTGPNRINPAEQIRLLEKAIAAKADAVLAQGIGDPQYRRLIDKAVSQGIAVIAVDTDEPGSRRLSYVGTDNSAAGERMGELVAQAASGQGTIGVIIGNEQAYNQRLRLDGFRSVIKRYPGLAVAEVRSSDISRLQAAEQAADLLTQRPEIGYMVGLSALDGPGIAEAARRVKPRSLTVFAFDDVKETRDGIRQGQISSAIVQQPREIGYQAVSLANDFFHGKAVQPQLFTSTTVLDRSSFGSETAGRTGETGGNGP